MATVTETLQTAPLGDEATYARWREQKLARYPRSLDELRVSVARLGAPTAAERARILDLCDRANMALYEMAEPESPTLREDLKRFGAAFGLVAAEDHRSAERDGIVSIEVVESGGRLGYIPYTDRPIHWHTDGYYQFNGPDNAIHAMLLHCARPADEGGVNRVLDPEIAYIRLRDRDPAFIAALAHPEAMTIPENVEPNGRLRPVNVGPVLFVEPRSGRLAMRFTARARNVIWRDDDTTRAAVAALLDSLDNDPLVASIQLKSGQGFISNNVLHDRSGFRAIAAAGRGRLFYRLRYRDRVGAAI